MRGWRLSLIEVGSFARDRYVIILKQCNFRKWSFVEMTDTRLASLPKASWRWILNWIWKEGRIVW